jgi:hypothetical protein
MKRVRMRARRIEVTTKEALHGLVDELPDYALAEAERYLTDLRDDRMLQVLLSAPYDDEPTTPEEDEGAREAWEEYLRGDFLSADEAKRALLD